MKKQETSDQPQQEEVAKQEQPVVAKEESVFDVLSRVDCTAYVETKRAGGTELSYLSWAWAWASLKRRFPDASFSVREWDGKPFLYEPSLGYLVQTTLTINGQSLTMHLPVMDSANRAMKATAYTYKTKMGEKVVEAATMMDINKAIQRCLVKNIGLFGLGLNLYAGEDLPMGDKLDIESAQDESALKKICAEKKASGLNTKALVDSYYQRKNILAETPKGLEANA